MFVLFLYIVSGIKKIGNVTVDCKNINYKLSFAAFVIQTQILISLVKKRLSLLMFWWRLTAKS